jgi:acetyl esterase/lipase
MPVGHVTSQSPPAFLAIAPEDGAVDPAINTMAMTRRLGAAGVPFVLKTYEHVNHMTLAGAFAAPLRFLAPVLDDVAAFVSDPSRQAP